MKQTIINNTVIPDSWLSPLKDTFTPKMLRNPKNRYALLVLYLASQSGVFSDDFLNEKGVLG